MKYSWELKLECVNKYKNGEYIAHPEAPNQRECFIVMNQNAKHSISLRKRFQAILIITITIGLKAKTKWMPPSKFREASMLAL